MVILNKKEETAYIQDFGDQDDLSEEL
jgi:hypothetical protein